MPEIALVTGCSSGMGLHAAVSLAARGMTVIATVRDLARTDALTRQAELAGVQVHIELLEVTDHAAATQLVARIGAEHGPVSVLVNNAGIGSVATAEQLTTEALQHQLDVNYLAPAHLTRLVLPAMREAGRGRVLTVTSVGGVVGQPFADAYCGAKFAVEGFMQSLAAVMHPLGVWVSVVEPAAVASEFVGNALRGDPSGPYAQLLQAYLARSEQAFASAQSADEAGRAIADAASADEYRFRWQTSPAARAFAGVSLADLDGSRVQAATASWVTPG